MIVELMDTIEEVFTHIKNKYQNYAMKRYLAYL